MTNLYVLCSFGTFFPVLVQYNKKNLATLDFKRKHENGANRFAAAGRASRNRTTRRADQPVSVRSRRRSFACLAGSTSAAPTATARTGRDAKAPLATRAPESAPVSF
jgi:hypothetical protein